MATKKSKKSLQSERSQRAAEMQAQARRAERRRSGLIIGGTALVGCRDHRRRGLRRDRPEQGERGRGGGRSGRPGRREDLRRPRARPRRDRGGVPADPVGGRRPQPGWQNCGFYDSEVAPENATHSLEHGAVWIGYSPDLADDEVSEVEDIVSQNDYVLASPVEGMDAPVTLSAWGYQIARRERDRPGGGRLHRGVPAGGADSRARRLLPGRSGQPAVSARTSTPGTSAPPPARPARGRLRRDRAGGSSRRPFLIAGVIVLVAALVAGAMLLGSVLARPDTSGGRLGGRRVLPRHAGPPLAGRADVVPGA